MIPGGSSHEFPIQTALLCVNKEESANTAGSQEMRNSRKSFRRSRNRNTKEGNSIFYKGDDGGSALPHYPIYSGKRLFLEASGSEPWCWSPRPNTPYSWGGEETRNTEGWNYLLNPQGLIMATVIPSRGGAAGEGAMSYTGREIWKTWVSG